MSHCAEWRRSNFGRRPFLIGTTARFHGVRVEPESDRASPRNRRCFADLAARFDRRRLAVEDTLLRRLDGL